MIDFEKVDKMLNEKKQSENNKKGRIEKKHFTKKGLMTFLELYPQHYKQYMNGRELHDRYAKKIAEYLNMEDVHQFIRATNVIQTATNGNSYYAIESLKEYRMRLVKLLDDSDFFSLEQKNKMKSIIIEAE